MEVKGENYQVLYDVASATVNFHGTLRLNGTEDYSHILNLLEEVVDSDPPRITLNLRHLDFLNSSGITMLSKFIISMRKKTMPIHMMILGSNTVPWQGKSLKNLQRLMPSLSLKFV
jgi:hypothetical protein